MRRKDEISPGSGNIAGLKHSGTEISCDIAVAADGMSLKVVFTGGTNRKSQTIRIQGKSPVDMFCPSVEGTVVRCFLKSGAEQIYDMSGNLLSAEELKGKWNNKIHFYD